MTLGSQDIFDAINARQIDILPFMEGALQPASYDLRLGADILAPQMGVNVDGAEYRGSSCDGTEGYILSPGCFILGVTLERIRLGTGIAAQLSGRSTWGRRGVAVHITAGWIDPGWDGRLTLELANFGPNPVRLRAGDSIAQLVFFKLKTPTNRPYDGRYKHDSTVSGPKAAVTREAPRPPLFGREYGGY